MHITLIRRCLFAAGLLALLSAAAGGWWLLQHSTAFAFLPANAGAQWILKSPSPSLNGLMAYPIETVFHRTFVLPAQPAQATVTLRAYKSAKLVINGQSLAEFTNQNWKLPVTADIASALKPGTNDIVVRVVNRTGPPALWLQLQAGEFSLASDVSWEASLAGAAFGPAQLASSPPLTPKWNPLHDDSRILSSVGHAWRSLALFLALSLGIMFWAGRNFSARPDGDKLVLGLFAFIVVARVVLFLHDAPELSQWAGFDAVSHEDYVRLIEQKGALPELDAGWETHQPPLYYALAAGVMKLTGLTAGQDNARVMLRAVNGFLGLLQCWIALLCFRQIFPKNFAAQAAGLLLAAFLPMNLCIPLFVANDVLPGLMISAALYFLLRIYRSKPENLWLYVAMGACLGAAMFSKLTALPMLPVFFFAVALRLVLHKKYSIGAWLRAWGATGFTCVAICIWQFARDWGHVHSVDIPHDAECPWWQTPGYRTIDYYLRFGQVLGAPLFSGLYGFADGIYSTLWGDGLASGASSIQFRSPWNYDLMNASYWLSLVPTAFALLGLGVAARRSFRNPGSLWFMLVLLVLIQGAALFALSLLAAWLNEVKAIYATPAVIPFCALMILGWNRLVRRRHALRFVAGTIMLLWAFTVFFAFWIRTGSAENLRYHALAQLHLGHYSECVREISKALDQNPNDAFSHQIYGDALNQLNRPGDALQQYALAVELDFDSPDNLERLGRILAQGQKPDAETAIKLTTHACELTDYGRASLVSVLAVADANAGNLEDAVAMAQKACDLQEQTGETNLITPNQKLISQCREQLAQKPAK